MSKEFEQQDPRDVAAQEAYVDALTGLPTMSQFFRKEDCEEARLRHMFAAGRALGRREMKGAKDAIAYAISGLELAYNAASKGFCDETLLHIGHHQAQLQKALDAIEAIPEEV